MWGCRKSKSRASREEGVVDQTARDPVGRPEVKSKAKGYLVEYCEKYVTLVNQIWKHWRTRRGKSVSRRQHTGIETGIGEKAGLSTSSRGDSKYKVLAVQGNRTIKKIKQRRRGAEHRVPEHLLGKRITVRVTE